MASRIAAIDCGTNTILLLIADADGNVLVDREEIVGLGRGFDRDGVLCDDAIARTLAQLEEYVTQIAAHHCDVVAAVGTEALRKAKNGGDVVARANALLARVGGRLEVIAGEREAQLCWRAARASFADLPLPFCVLDIGGGSTEFVVGDDAQRTVASVPIGSVRLSERFFQNDPPTTAQLTQTRAAIADALVAAPALAGTVIALAGTATTMAAIATGHPEGRVSRAQLAQNIERLCAMNATERRALGALHPGRADYVLAGALILEAVMARGNFSDFVASNRGVRWGLFFEHAK